MVLAVELDNSQISFGIFRKEEMVCHFHISTNMQKTSDEYLITAGGLFGHHGIDPAEIEGAIVSSVVPQLTDVMADVIKKIAGEIQILVVGAGCKTGFPIKVDHPSELGGDIVANVAAAIHMMDMGLMPKRPCMIVDMGMAGTIFAVNAKGELVGGTILPGMGMSAEALHEVAAQIPAVGLAMPGRAIGKNTRDSVRSGIVFGQALMIDGFIDRFCDELNIDDAEVLITGHFAKVVLPACAHPMRHIPNLTLMGLNCIYRNNVR